MKKLSGIKTFINEEVKVNDKIIESLKEYRKKENERLDLLDAYVKTLHVDVKERLKLKVELEKIVREVELYKSNLINLMNQEQYEQIIF
jgi:hypothetical protein